jgi:opacity protein-like surface antigen
LAGVRYFRFDDNLEYAAIGAPALAGNVLSYDVFTRNHLVGFQVGGRADYCVGNRMNLYSNVKSGIYGNRSNLDSRLGTPAYVAYGTGVPASQFSINRSDNDIAFMNELGAGVGLRLSPKWTANVGYRAVVASGVATAVGNLRYQGQTLAQTQINAKDYIVLHGLNVGAQYNF